MTYICGKYLKYVWKWPTFLTKTLKMWKMIKRFGKWPKYLGYVIDTWDTA